ncbi:MAG: thioredoxin domain-containing protein [Deltaproteobacteria bacterium]|nr:thioredoxin domain-containing protein [Deltaproteobacteria bacterium]
MPLKKQNRLGETKSPYLLQHKENPVHWFPWGEEAFQAARNEKKLIFLSIGYSTCYWCHMMEKDSFEHQDVADLLNRDFISIKVDREEHPDVDKIYMDAVVGMTGRGGWPMTVFLTPDLKPVFGGTFFWKAQFLELLNRLQTTWKQEPQRIVAAGEEVFEFLRQRNAAPEKQQVSEAVLRSAYEQMNSSFDDTYGGFGQAPKFPPAIGLSLLLRVYRRSGEKRALEIVTTTLDAMARGGIYDHLGGGFHRYSTDEQWLVPHFAKMLYDNALLAWSYLEAFQVTGKPAYASVAQQTLDYVLSVMTSPEGGFYSAEDAGEVGREGEYYVWREAELKALLTKEEFEAIRDLYRVTATGNFEHQRNILHRGADKKWGEEDSKVPLAHQKLRTARLTRPPPYKDDKVLTAWNGLMIAAMAKGHQVLGEKRYWEAARRAANFIRGKLWHEGAQQAAPLLLRRYRDGDSRFTATLDDYAFLIHGLLVLYESDFDPQWFEWAKILQKREDELFWDAQGGGYFFTSPEEKELVIRKKEVHDGAIPSGNSVAALNLLRLHALTAEPGYLEKARQLFESISAEITRYPMGHAQALIALDFELDQSKEIVVVGKGADPRRDEATKFFQQTFLPNKVLVVGEPTGRQDSKAIPLLQGKALKGGLTTVYICENQTCREPTNDLELAKKLVNDPSP